MSAGRFLEEGRYYTANLVDFYKGSITVDPSMSLGFLLMILNRLRSSVGRMGIAGFGEWVENIVVISKRYIFFIWSSAVTAGVPAFATIIYNGNTNNVNSIVNAVAGSTTLSQTGPVFSYTNTGNQNYNAGIASTQNIDTLLGRPLLETETVILKLTVDSITSDINANGYEFGLSPNGTAFRPSGHLIFQIRPNDATAVLAGNAFDGGGSASFALTEASVLNGFSGTLTASASGYTFAFTDVILASGANATYSGTFTSPAQFRDLFGGGHFYTTAQKTPADMSVSISEASINVIPEPSTGWLFLLGALVVGKGLRKPVYAPKQA